MEQQPQHPPARILVVDDNPVNRRLLVGMLQRQGYTVHEASDGEEALVNVPPLLPDLILMDVEMPRLDGFSACQQLKADPTTRDIPVLFLSSRIEPDAKIRGFELGGVDYVTKPFHQGEILIRVRTQLELRRLHCSLVQANEELRYKQTLLEQDLRAAAHIQHSMIPRRPPLDSRLRFAWAFHPCDRVGGDLFNIHRLDEEHLALYLFDVSGHGVPAAMVTASVAQSLSPSGGLIKQPSRTPPYYRIPHPAEVLSSLDMEYPIERFDKFCTLCYLLLDGNEASCTYSSAGHPPTILQHAGGDIALLARGGSIIGLGDMAVPFEEENVTLLVGDRLFLHTDGIIEHTGPDGRQFGLDNLLAAIGRTRGMKLADAVEAVIAEVKDYGLGRPCGDDITFIAVEYGESTTVDQPAP